MLQYRRPQPPQHRGDDQRRTGRDQRRRPRPDVEQAVGADPGRAGDGDDRGRPEEPAEPARRTLAAAEGGPADQAGRGDGREQQHPAELVPQLGPEEQRRDDRQRAADVAEDLGEHRRRAPAAGCASRAATAAAWSVLRMPAATARSSRSRSGGCSVGMVVLPRVGARRTRAASAKVDLADAALVRHAQPEAQA